MKTIEGDDTMCIIIAKPAGVDMPVREIFNNCCTTNRDGIGFAFNKPGENPTISKGFSNVGKLIRMMDTFNIGKEHNLMVHFRLATHGKADQGNCHPFPLTPDFIDMRKLHCSCEVAISHNGVFGSMPLSNQHSDTMKFIHSIVGAPEIVNSLESKAVKELIKGYCGFHSKLAFLKPSGFNLVGDFELDEGVYYSNRAYKSWNCQPVNGWCEVHRKYDKCFKEAKKLGTSYCYLHKSYDHCSWCTEHQKMDDCSHNKNKTLQIVHKIVHKTQSNYLDLRNTCEWCAVEENVKYDTQVQSYLCDQCSASWGEGILPVQNRYDQ
jgi:hypothetical protein